MLQGGGPGSECVRCLFAAALMPDDVPPGGESLVSTGTADHHRYSQFEISTTEDGAFQELGAGAMGVTYRAQDRVLNRPVALKVISRSYASDAGTRARFLREARSAAQLRHINVASVHHYGEQDGQCFYAMELVEGETLEARVRREGPLPVPLALEITVQVARALAAAEAQGIVHRDLKPSNIMLVATAAEHTDGALVLVKVIDFGLAKAVAAEAQSTGGLGDTHGGFVGTPAFASPEQHARDGERIDTRSDIYSLGVTFWYLLSGSLPFVGQTLSEIHEQQVGQPLPLGQLRAVAAPAPLVALLRSMLAVAPAARPQSARELLDTLARTQKQLRAASPAARVARWGGALAALALLAAGAALWREHRRPSVPASDHSLAVLPFENLSVDPADAFFTTGVQDEIAADLAHVASLKVIGPDSTRPYPPMGRDLARIGQELGVAYLLEGSVRRMEGRVAISVRLVNAGNSARVWASKYDRPLADVFAVQSDITHAVVNRLQAPLTSGESASVKELPTSDLVAYDFYLRAREGPTITADEAAERQEQRRKITLLEKAVVQDPDFFLAYCGLAKAYDTIQYRRAGATVEELAVDHQVIAEGYLATARRLRPDAGELHLAQAYHFFTTYSSQAQARIEVDLARRSLPNNAEVESLAGQIARSQGRWEDAIYCFEQAVVLEPRDRGILYNLALTYLTTRRYEAFGRTMSKLITITPEREQGGLPLEITLGAFEGRADTAPLRAALATFVVSKESDERKRDKFSILLYLADHNADGLSRVLAASKQDRFVVFSVTYPREWYEALSARIRGDEAGARAAFAAARPEVEKSVLANPSSSRLLSLLAMVDAGLGRAESIDEAKRACSLVVSPTAGPVIGCNLAVVYAWLGQPDMALAELEKWIDQPAGGNTPSQPTYGDLKLNPLWDALRGNPRFDAITQRLAPPG